MNYEVVTCEEKTVVGLTARMSNDDPKMGAIIGGLWQKLFGEGVFEAIADKTDAHAIGLYADYATDVTGAYSLTTGCAVRSADALPAGTVVRTIPAGRYAKFVLRGEGDAAAMVGAAWGEIWATPLERTYTGDFEEYLTSPEDQVQEVHIYMAIK